MIYEIDSYGVRISGNDNSYVSIDVFIYLYTYIYIQYFMCIALLQRVFLLESKKRMCTYARAQN